MTTPRGHALPSGRTTCECGVRLADRGADPLLVAVGHRAHMDRMLDALCVDVPTGDVL